MKRYSKLFYALALIPFLALSCQEEEIYEAGEEDNSACYGVFFPEQDGVGAVELDPTDPTQKVIKVSRTKSEGEITVPIDLITKDPEGFWKVTELKFENGQEDTTIVLSFDDAEVGKAGYSVTLQISDPMYASKYSKNATYINYAPQRVKWNDVLVNDVPGSNVSVFTDVLQTLFSGLTPLKWNVLVQERDDQPGVYRIIDPYYDWVPAYQAATGDNDPISYGHSTLVINASDPDAVWIPVQCVGITDLWGYGEIMIGSKYAVYMELGDTSEEAIAAGAAPRGKMVNGVITFPKDEICLWMTGYGALEDGWWYANVFNKFIVPGGVETDYSLDLEVGEPNLGISEFTITGGADIDTVRYAAFTNTMKTAEIGDAAAAIRMGTVEGLQKLSIYEKGDTTVNVQFDTTGIFTIVAVGYDTAGVAQTTASVEFGYLKNGDENPVQLYADIANNPVIVKDSSSLAFSFLGRDITELKFDIFNAATFSADPMEALNGVIEDGNTLSEKNLELVNSTGFTSMMKGLIPGTDFVLVWWAFNGYVSDYGVVGPAKTSGDALPIYLDYDWADISEPDTLKQASDWYGKYNLYAIEAYTNKSGIREFIGKVTVAKGSVADTAGLAKYGIFFDGYDWFDVTGILAPSAKKKGHSDVLKFYLEEGLPVWYNYGESSEQSALDGGTDGVSLSLDLKSGDASDAALDYSYFVPVAPGYWAFLYNPYYLSKNDAYWGGIGVYAGGWSMVMTDILLVDETLDDNGIVPMVKPSGSAAAFTRFYTQATSAKKNYVERNPKHVYKTQASYKLPKASTKVEFKALNFDIPSQPVKMTVSAKPTTVKEKASLKGGQIRKQDARVRR